VILLQVTNGKERRKKDEMGIATKREKKEIRLLSIRDNEYSASVVQEEMIHNEVLLVSVQGLKTGNNIPGL
jgi:hypothetical protein